MSHQQLLGFVLMLSHLPWHYREEPTELESRIQKALQFIVEQRQQTALKRQKSAGAGSPKAKSAPSE